MKSPKTKNPLTRRSFISRSLAASSFLILPSYAVAQSKNAKARSATSPNGRVRVAFVGIGNRGNAIIKSFAKSEMIDVVALCDVDLGAEHTQEMMAAYPNAKTFQDFRVMFDKVGDQFDAVAVAIPDHAHFAVAMHAMKAGKHVYVEKPLAHTFQEVELLMEMEKKSGLVTQMGNQGHSGGNYFQFKAWTEAGVIKDVTKVLSHMNSPRRWHGWQIDGWEQGETAPDTIDWDLWNMARPVKPFSSKLHPGNWRSWFDYGNGAFGDWGPHILDTCHRFLEFGLPNVIEAEKRDGPNDLIFPQASTIRFDFPKRGKMPKCEVFWYDGVENLPELPAEDTGERRKNGKYIFSKDYVFKGGTHSDTLRIIPEEKMREVIRELPKFSQRNSDHSENFLLACKGEEEVRSPFNVSGPLTQVFLLGVIAQRLGGKLKFNRKKKIITNSKIGNEFLVGPPPRNPFAEYYKV